MENEKTRKTLRQLAEMVGGEVHGRDDVMLEAVNDVQHAVEGQITFIAKAPGVRELLVSNASAAVVPAAADVSEIPIPVMRVKNPYLAITIIHNHFLDRPFAAVGVSPAAHIGRDCVIPDAVTIGHHAVLGDRVHLGERVTVHPCVVLGDDVSIGDDSILYPNVTVYPSTVIGKRVIVHGGTVIGSDGYGFVTDERGRHVKRPHVGRVEVEDDVEIGANVCIDRATFGVTRIGKGSKIDNLVQIGHNVQIGPGCLVVSQVGISGSTMLGKHVVLGGQAGLAGHLKIADGVMVGAKSGVAGDQEEGAVVSGTPAIAHAQWRRATAAFAKLPEMVKDIRELKKRVNELFSRIG